MHLHIWEDTEKTSQNFGWHSIKPQKNQETKKKKNKITNLWEKKNYAQKKEMISNYTLLQNSALNYHLQSQHHVNTEYWPTSNFDLIKSYDNMP